MQAHSMIRDGSAQWRTAAARKASTDDDPGRRGHRRGTGNRARTWPMAALGVAALHGSVRALPPKFAAALDDTRRCAGLARIELRTGLAAGSGRRCRADIRRRAGGRSRRNPPCFHQLRRRLLARAAKRGVVSRTSLERAAISARVFSDLHVMTRRRLGVPVRRLFDLMGAVDRFGSRVRADRHTWTTP